MKVHYFQRYKGKENTVTNNVMLMLSRLYNYNSSFFYSMVSEWISNQNEENIGNDIDLDINFELQPDSNGDTIPDAIIGQESFKIIVETKLSNNFNESQLKGHLEKFKEGKFKDAKFKLLLTLGKEPMKSDLKIIKGEIKKYAAVHINLTFKDLLENIGKQIDERDKDISEVFEDFKLYCVEAGLTPEEYLMGAVLTNNTIKDNKVYNLYYHPSTRSDLKCTYIGLYKEKEIKYIGKISKIIKASNKDEKFEIKKPENGVIEKEEEDRIKKAMGSNKVFEEYHTFFIVDEFYETKYKKESKGGLMGLKYFNLKEILDLEESSEKKTEEIANELKGKLWK